jgi:hypothetical protein
MSGDVFGVVERDFDAHAELVKLLNAPGIGKVSNV